MAVKTLQEFEELAKKLSQKTKEVRIAVLLTELLENNVITDEQFRIHPKGIFKRNYRNEIDQIAIVRNKDSKTPKYLKFDIWKEGIYDSLPKGIFHNLRQDKTPKTIAKIKEQLVKQEEEKQAARDFFHPIEQAFYRLRILIEKQERGVLSGFRDVVKIRRLFSLLWAMDIEGIEHSKAITLYHFLPYVFDYKGDLSSLDKIFSLLLNTQVLIVKIEGNLINVPLNLQVTLGACSLGNNTVLGSVFSENTPRLQISLPLLSAKEAADYVPNRPSSKLLTILSNYLLPVDAETLVDIQLEKKERQFVLPRLTDSKIPCFNNILGYTTYLS